VSQPPTLRSESLDTIVRAAVARADNLTCDHRVVLSLGESLPSLGVDAAAIVEVFYMLLDNASKYSPTGTAIHISASMADPHFVTVQVEDEGPGVPPELRERVFEKFFRVPAREPTDPRRVSVGLGLPIARRLVEAQGGRISIGVPSSGRGMAVLLRLPLAAGSVEPTPLEAPLNAAAIAR
jgi:two-component system sensor histidine kinase KdpD